ncbi:MAG: hypothetical protein AB8H03_24415 [Saprospiraceae bacterium]
MKVRCLACVERPIFNLFSVIKATGKINRLDYGIGDSDQIDLRVLGEFRKTN